MAGPSASQITTRDGLVQIDVIYPRSDQHSVDGVLEPPIRTNAGRIVHIGDVAYVRYLPTPNLLALNRAIHLAH
jgi:hypothetical protein